MKTVRNDEHFRFSPGKHKKKKKNPVRVHVATTTEESVKPFHYKKQANMPEFCLGECI